MIYDFKYNSTRKSSVIYGQTWPWQSLGKIRIKFLIVLSILLTLLLSTQLVFATNLSVGGQTLSKIEQEISQLETENLNLSVKIAQASSLTHLWQRAQNLGYSTPEKIITP